MEQTDGYGSSLPPTVPVLLSSGPSEGTPILLVEPTPSVHTTMQQDHTRYASPTTGYEQQSTIFTQGPPTTYEPSTQNIPSSSPSNGDRLYFSQDIYPLYKYPTLYEPNYPAPNQDVYIPGGYAANAQEVDEHFRPTTYDENVRPSPSTNHHGPPKPVFGLGYGNGYSYGQPESYNPSTMRPQDSGYSTNPQRPTNVNRDPRPSEYGHRDPMRPPSYGNDNRDRDPLRPSGYDISTPNYYPRPDNERGSSPSYESRPESAYSSPAPYGPPQARPSSLRPNGYMDFTNRPDAPDGTPRPSTFGPNEGNTYDNNHMRRNSTAVSSRPGGYNDDKQINTYFNPDDYLGGNKSE